MNAAPLPRTLAVDAGPQPFDSRDDLADHTRAMLTQTKHRARIFTHDLESRLYDQPDMLDTFGHLARSGPHARIEILVFDPRAAVREGHRLIELARRLSSFIELRQVHEDYQRDPAAFALFDERGLIYRPLHALYNGFADYNAPNECLEKHKFFQSIWERSGPVQEFRRLYL